MFGCWMLFVKVSCCSPCSVFIISTTPKKSKAFFLFFLRIFFIFFIKLFPESTENYHRRHNNMQTKQSNFFEFFRTKRLKLSLAIFFGTVGVISNYSALKYYIANTRIDLIGSEWLLTIYALGISIGLDLAIVVFHLMRTYALMWGSVLLAFLVSLTANTTTYLTCAGACNNYLDDWGAYLGFTQALMMSILPIVIIVYLTELAVSQYDREVEEVYKNSWQNIKMD